MSPYKKEYSGKTMAKMPMNHAMGSQGHPVKIPVSVKKSKPTKHTKFPG